MAIYVVIAEGCKSDIKDNISLIEKTAEKLRKLQNLSCFETFLPTHFLKKRLPNNRRLIAYRKFIDDCELIIFLKVFQRSDNKYKSLIARVSTTTESEFFTKFQSDIVIPDPRQQSGSLVIKSPYSEDDFKSLLKTLEAEPTTKVTSLPKPNSVERLWLYEVLTPTTQNARDVTILETESWVKKMNSKSMVDFRGMMHENIQKICDSKAELQKHTPNCDNQVMVIWNSNKTLGTVFYYYSTKDQVLLVEPLLHDDNEDEVKKKHEKLIERALPTLETIAVRSYPDFIVADPGAWLKIQKDKESNLALSPEESKLLESVHHSASSGKCYPLFINGRAGSGKSTMLQYLAADYVGFALSEKDDRHSLLYMTYSADLLDRAKMIVKGMLEAHYKTLQNNVHDSSEIQKIINSTFVVFHDYLLSLLPEDAQKKFPSNKKINYSVFSDLWSKTIARQPAPPCSSELAWHTIRSYIKGINGDLTPEEFRALPRKRKSISDEMYDKVYAQVWEKWYKQLCATDSRWDDQDLASCVLEEDCAKGANSIAIFCDEAQDFTPIELDIIMQLSLFGGRTLVPEELKLVPIAFAGDPLQTINPTGFRWEAVREDFMDRFNAVLDPRRKAQIDPNYVELEFNYRSNPGIVQFCNLIQLVRAVLLNAHDIHPQKTWGIEIETTNSPVYFETDKSETQDLLIQTEDFVKIINCEDGEETNYVKEDDVLNRMKEEPEGVYPNVLGPTRAKGMEFPAVVLYRFGDKTPTCPVGFQSLIDGTDDLNEKESRLPFEYFFNRLYVAASRAKSQLIIVDSPSAFSDFWSFATDPHAIEKLLDRAPGGRERWEKHVIGLLRGNEKSWRGHAINLQEQADEYKAQASIQRSSFLMRQAAHAYRNANMNSRAGSCLALACELDGEHKAAGEKYRTLGEYKEAFRCFWNGCNWSLLCELIQLDPSQASNMESQAARFMKLHNETSLTEFLKVVVAASKDEEWTKGMKLDPTWMEVFKTVSKMLSETDNVNINWRETYSTFVNLSKLEVYLTDKYFPLIAYKAKDFAAAAGYWENIDDTRSEKYYLAKAQITSFPENLIFWSRSSKHSEVIARWKKYKSILEGKRPPEDVMKAVTDSAFAEEDFGLVAEMLKYKAEVQQVESLLMKAIQRNEVETIKASLKIAVRLIVNNDIRTKEWKHTPSALEVKEVWLNFLSTEKTYAIEQDMASKLASSISAILGKEVASNIIFCAVIEELSMSDELVSTGSGGVRNSVVSFLKYNFISSESLAKKHHTYLNLVSVGAAIERAGKIVDALRYYEQIISGQFTKDEKKFAAERLVKNNERYADFKKTDDKDEYNKRITKANAIREEFSLGSNSFEEYPFIPEIDNSSDVSKPGNDLLKVTELQNYRVRIEHKKLQEIVTVYCLEKELRGEVETVLVKKAEEWPLTWQISGWNVGIKLFTTKNGYKIEICPRDCMPIIFLLDTKN
ncbi:MAG: hypothetical protein NUW37_13170 [Planctomycetes bacterium]|nr:hypothetical protein [Planctomycetota bacterium]